MAVELYLAKDSLKTIAQYLGITPQILARWCRERLSNKKANSGGRVGVSGWLYLTIVVDLYDRWIINW